MRRYAPKNNLTICVDKSIIRNMKGGYDEETTMGT